MSPTRSIFIGFDSRETNNFVVCVKSAVGHMRESIEIRGLVLDTLRRQGLYTRKTSVSSEGKLWDCISEAPMSSEFANSRFLVPVIQKEGWALFADCDTMFLADPADVFALADSSKAVMCVKHNHVPVETKKKSGEVQTVYPRKNWSSVMLFNCEHPANEKLTVEMVNTLPGRDLHRFCWLQDDEIGELPPTWNHLVTVSELAIGSEPLNLIHWTLGSPDILARENTEFYDDYHRVLNSWANRGGSLS